MIKKILVPQDGSEYSKSTLAYALWLSKRLEASLIGIHVVDIISLEGPFLHDLSGSIGFEPYLNFSTKMREALEAKGASILSQFEDACRTEGAGCETYLTSGIVPNEICEKAKIADLVIMGKRGVNAKFEYELHGSTTENVLRKSPKPVLITPEQFKELKNPLLAYDGSHSASKAMHSAAELAKALCLPLTVITVSGGEETLLRDAEGYLRPYGLKMKLANIKGDPPIAIEKYYNDNGHDLLFMGTSHHSRLVELVLGSTTEHVMRRVAGPFFLER